MLAYGSSGSLVVVGSSVRRRRRRYVGHGYLCEVRVRYGTVSSGTLRRSGFGHVTVRFGHSQVRGGSSGALQRSRHEGRGTAVHGAILTANLLNTEVVTEEILIRTTYAK